MTKKKIIKSIAIVGRFLPITLLLSIIMNTFWFPPFGKFDFSHLPTLVLGVTGHPWLAAINALLADVLGTMIRGQLVWVHYSIAKVVGGLVIGYLALLWVNKFKLKIDWIFVSIIFILIYYLVEFIGYAEATKFYLNKGYEIAALRHFPPRFWKTPIMLPLWYYLMTYFAKKKDFLV